MPEIPTPDTTVVVSYLHPGWVEAGFHTSMINLFMWDLTHHQRIILQGGHQAIRSGANITSARNDAVRDLLDGHDGWDWFLSVDSDQTFPPDAVDRLIAAADPVERPIVGALCFGQWLGSGKPVVFPTIYWWAQDEQGNKGALRADRYPVNTVLPVGGTGAGFMLIHRTVLETMRDKYPGPWHWYQEIIIDGRPVSEDMVFCLRAAAAGFPTHVHTGVKVGHTKETNIDEATFVTQETAGGRPVSEILLEFQ